MAATAVPIAAVWGVMLGGAYLCRAVWRLPRAASAGAMTGLYLVLGALALLWFGVDQAGFLGALGMLLPYAVSLLLAMPRRRMIP